MKMILSLLLSMSILTNCQQNGVVRVEEKNLPAQTLREVAYGKDTAQRMDIYLPAGRRTDSTKIIVLIHGGGWTSGSKSEFAVYIDSFRKRMPDYAIFNMNYRLYNGKNLFPAQENDVRSAIDFISSHAKEYQVNTNKMVLLGASAGAHLALLQAYKYNEPKIQAVIDFFGPTDLTAMHEHPWHPLVTYALNMVTGTTPSANAGLYFQSSPINFVNPGSAPTLIFHGSNDQVVNISQSKSLNQRLEQAGVIHELVVYPGQQHGWHGSTLSNSFDRIEVFLRKNVK
jgi:acetyl esterase/lipase